MKFVQELFNQKELFNQTIIIETKLHLKLYHLIMFIFPNKIKSLYIYEMFMLNAAGINPHTKICGKKKMQVGELQHFLSNKNKTIQFPE